MANNPEEKIFKIGICDSDTEMVKKYVNFLEQWLETKKKEYRNCKVQIYGFLTDHEVYQYLVQDGKALDLLLQSTGIEKEKGLQAAEEIQNKHPQLNIVFLTKHIQSHLEVYPWKKCFFCLRDDMKQWLPQLIDKVWNEKEQQEENVFQWEWSRRKHIVLVSNILYCERELRVTHIYYMEGEAKCLLKLNELEDIFNKNQQVFCRCHNSFLVNLKYVERMGKYDLTLKNGTVIPISRSHKKETSKRYHDILSHANMTF